VVFSRKGGVQYDVGGDLPEPCADAQATARGHIEQHFLPTSHEKKRMIKIQGLPHTLYFHYADWDLPLRLKKKGYIRQMAKEDFSSPMPE
jgi:hypothetical protein